MIIKFYNQYLLYFCLLILIVVLVPSNINDWLKITEEDMLMRKCGYWVSLKGQKPTKNTNNITVELPRQNLFTEINEFEDLAPPNPQET